MASLTEEEQKELILAELNRAGIKFGASSDDKWNVEDRPLWVEAQLGTWVADRDLDMIESGEEGQLTANVVGAPQYNNVRVAFFFGTEDTDPDEVVPFDDVVPV